MLPEESLNRMSTSRFTIQESPTIFQLLLYFGMLRHRDIQFLLRAATLSSHGMIRIPQFFQSDHFRIQENDQGMAIRRFITQDTLDEITRGQKHIFG